jgi:hypothetical protein
MLTLQQASYRSRFSVKISDCAIGALLFDVPIAEAHNEPSVCRELLDSPILERDRLATVGVGDFYGTVWKGPL